MKRAVAVAALLAAAVGEASPGRVALESLSPAAYAPRVAAAHAGRVLVVNFWATWCQPCRDEMPGLIQAARKWKRTDLVLVSSDARSERDAAARFLAPLRPSGPAFIVDAADPQDFIDAVDRRWDGALPYTVVYDARGHLVERLSGEQTPAALDAAVTRALGR